MPLHATDKRARSFKNLENQDVTLYVRPGGNDANNGLTPVTAFATLKRALYELEKDYGDGKYFIDITGCTIDEIIVFPQLRGLTRNELDVNNVTSYGSRFKGALNIYAMPNVVHSGIRILSGDPTTFNGTRTRLTMDTSFSADSLIGRFLRTPDGQYHVVYANDLDWIEISAPSLSSPNTQDLVDFVEPGATVTMSSKYQYLIAGLLSGVIISGIRFVNGITSSSQSLCIQNCSDIIIENCSFVYTNGAYRAVQIGGFGLVKFVTCSVVGFAPLFRYVGGSVAFQQGVCKGGSLFAEGTFAAYNTLTYPSAPIIYIQNSIVDDLGTAFNSSSFTKKEIRITDSDIGYSIGSFEHSNIETRYCFFRDPVNISKFVDWKDGRSVFNDTLTIADQSRFNADSTTLDSLILGGASIPLVSGAVSLIDSASGSELIGTLA